MQIGGNKELVNKIINHRISYLPKETNDYSNMDPSFIKFLEELKAEAPSREEQIKQIEEEVHNLESRIDESKEFIDPIAGNLDFKMSDDEIKKVIQETLTDFRNKGILVTDSEFNKEDKNKYHPQRSLNLWRSMEIYDETMADITRIFGADYLAKKFKEYGKEDILLVPKYRLVVPDLKNIKVLVNSSNKYGLVLYGVQGMLYADKISGTPAMKKFLDEAVEAARSKGIMKDPGDIGFAEKVKGLFPKPDNFGKILINTRWADYGPGLVGSTPWDNVIKSAEKYYFIDTELKSFDLLYIDDEFGKYLRERFALAREKDPDKSKLDFYYTLKLYK